MVRGDLIALAFCCGNAPDVHSESLLNTLMCEELFLRELFLRSF